MPEIWRKAWWPKAWWPGRWRHFRFLVIGFPKAPVAQLDRVLPSEGRGHRFESCRVRQASLRELLSPHSLRAESSPVGLSRLRLERMSLSVSRHMAQHDAAGAKVFHPGIVHFALAVGGFAIGTTEFATMSLVPFFSRDLHITAPMAGHVISAYALGVVVGAPLIAVLSARVARRTLLLWLMG